MKREWLVPKNREARIAQRIGVATAILLALFPPWEIIPRRMRFGFPEFGGFHPLWSPPRDHYGIDLTLLFFLLFTIAALTKTAVRILNRVP